MVESTMLTLIKVNEFPFFLRLYKVGFIWILVYYYIILYNRRNNKRGTRESHINVIVTRKLKHQCKAIRTHSQQHKKYKRTGEAPEYGE